MMSSFFKFHVDQELKTVLEKNREYESAQEKLSSEKVMQTTFSNTIILLFLWSTAVNSHTMGN